MITRNATTALAALSTLALIACGIILPQVLGTTWEAYNAAASYLSELGAQGAPTATPATWLSFAPVALSSATLIYLLWKALPATWLIRVGLTCMLGITVGYMGAVLYPCDAGCPASGTARQAMHNLAGITQYLGICSGLLLLALGLYSARMRFPATFTLFTFLVVIAAFTAMTLPEFDQHKGIAQRTADYGTFIWLSCLVWRTTHSPPATTSR